MERSSTWLVTGQTITTMLERNDNCNTLAHRYDGQVTSSDVTCADCGTVLDPAHRDQLWEYLEYAAASMVNSPA